MGADVKGNGHDKEVPMIKRNDVKLADSQRNRWWAVLNAAQFRERLNGAIWATRTKELRRYDEITVLAEDESEMAVLLVTDCELGSCNLVELSNVKIPPRKPLQAARIPNGYEAIRDTKGYRVKRLKDGAFMGPYQPRLEDAVRDLLDHASLRQQ